ncbi:MAG: hypothetical protein ABS84_14115 [Rubrivivax sp. SCN 71-131]|nr:MAG: hypothetical protein ABS84_14115 [Rubrivivax sp. SCN 71-131]
MITPVPAIGNAATLPLSALILRPQIRTRNGFDEPSLRELAASIRENGILQPIVVAPTEDVDRYHLIAGERRLLAAELAGLSEIPATIRTGTQAELAIMQAVENLQRVDLSALDIAEGLRALRPAYKTGAALARAVGKSTAWVSKHLSLTRLTNTAKAIAENGMQDVETILIVDQLARLAPTDQAMRAVKVCMKAAEAGNLTRALARACLDQAKKATTPTPAPEDDNDDGTDGNDQNDAAAVADTDLRTITLRMAPDWAQKFEELGGLDWLLAQIAAA